MGDVGLAEREDGALIGLVGWVFGRGGGRDGTGQGGVGQMEQKKERGWKRGERWMEMSVMVHGKRVHSCEE